MYRPPPVSRFFEQQARMLSKALSQKVLRFLTRVVTILNPVWMQTVGYGPKVMFLISEIEMTGVDG